MASSQKALRHPASPPMNKSSGGKGRGKVNIWDGSIMSRGTSGRKSPMGNRSVGGQVKTGGRGKAVIGPKSGKRMS